MILCLFMNPSTSKTSAYLHLVGSGQNNIFFFIILVFSAQSPKPPMYTKQDANPHFLPHLQDQRPRQPPQGPGHLHGQFTQPSPRPHDPLIPQGNDTHHPHFQPSGRRQESEPPPPAIHPKTRTHGKHGGGVPPPQLHQGRHRSGEHGGDPGQQSRLQPGRQHGGDSGQQSRLQPGRQHGGDSGQQSRLQPGRQQGQPQQLPPSYRMTPSRKTRPIAWLIAAFCTLFWIVVIVAGLTVLIIYLVYRPRLPKFDISTATLNAAYLDMGTLLNADLTILGNFSNPNKKVNVYFSFVILDLYYESNLIATRYVEPFTAIRGQSVFEDIHMVTSQVRLPMAISQELTTQMNNGRVKFDVKGLFRARSKLGGVFRYSYWLYSHCTITVSGPPTGALIGKNCKTKR